MAVTPSRRYPAEQLLADLTEIATHEVGSPIWLALTDAFLVATKPLCEAIARRLTRYPGIEWKNDSDDIVQLVMMVHSEMLKEVGSGTFRKPVAAWEAVLVTRARSAIKDYAESGQVTGISAYTGVRRRQRSMHRIRTELEALYGRPPTDTEVVEAHNAQVRSTRVDTTKQAAIASEHDLIGLRLLNHDPRAIPDQVHGDLPITPAEGADLVRTVVRAAYQEGERLGRVAQVWLSWYPDGAPLSTAETSRQAGVPWSTVAKDINRIQDILLQHSSAYEEDTALSF